MLDAHTPLPPAFWGTESGLNCLDTVVESVWDEGWSHHITRLMVLANLATLLDIDPRQLTDWFWVAYIDNFGSHHGQPYSIGILVNENEITNLQRRNHRPSWDLERFYEKRSQHQYE